jgi:hypothetical protein
VSAEQGGDLDSVGGSEQGLVAAVLGKPDGADESLGDLVGQDDPGEAQANEPGEGAEGRRDERDQGDPLDRSLA